MMTDKEAMKDSDLVVHLALRCCDPSEYTVHLDHEGGVATFILYTLGVHKFAGYQQYKMNAPKTRDGKGFHPQDLRYFTHVVEGELAVFGTETLDRPGPVYIVEGIFDAVKLHSLGLACLAVLGNGAVPKRGRLGSPLQNQLRAMNRKVVGVLDNDDAGRALATVCDEVFVCTEKDPGDMTLDELKGLLQL